VKPREDVIEELVEKAADGMAVAAAATRASADEVVSAAFTLAHRSAMAAVERGGSRSVMRAGAMVILMALAEETKH
jgi:hypothetical protein